MRGRHPAEDHDFYSRMHACGLRGIATTRGPTSYAATLASRLCADSEEDREVWERHEVGIRPREVKRYEKLQLLSVLATA